MIRADLELPKENWANPAPRLCQGRRHLHRCADVGWPPGSGRLKNKNKNKKQKQKETAGKTRNKKGHSCLPFSHRLICPCQADPAPRIDCFAAEKWVWRPSRDRGQLGTGQCELDRPECSGRSMFSPVQQSGPRSGPIGRIRPQSHGVGPTACLPWRRDFRRSLNSPAQAHTLQARSGTRQTGQTRQVVAGRGERGCDVCCAAAWGVSSRLTPFRGSHARVRGIS